MIKLSRKRFYKGDVDDENRFYWHWRNGQRNLS